MGIFKKRKMFYEIKQNFLDKKNLPNYHNRVIFVRYYYTITGFYNQLKGYKSNEVIRIIQR